MPIPKQEIQLKALRRVREYRLDAENESKPWRERMLEVYRTYKTFTKKDPTNASGDYYVNKAHEVVEKVVPRLIAKNPKWIVTPRDLKAFQTPQQEAFVPAGETKSINQVIQDRASEFSAAVQDLLTYIWDEYGLREKFKLIAKALIVYGKAYAKTDYKYEIARISAGKKKAEKEEPVQNILEEEGENVITEEIIGEYPTVTPISWTNIFYDP